MRDLKSRYGSRALVTGATSGLGEAYARSLAAMGFDVILTGRREDRLNALAAELKSTHGIAVLPIACDLQSPTGPASLVQQIHDHGWEVDLFINNAGYGKVAQFGDAASDEPNNTTGNNACKDMLGMIDLNCRAVTELTHHLLPGMRKRQRGGIVIISSVAAYIPLPYMSVYAATKAFDLLLAEGLFHECRRDGVDILAVAPGVTKTEFAQRAGSVRFKGPSRVPEQVVRTTWRAIGRKPRVVDGWTNNLAVAILSIIPRRLAAYVVAKSLRSSAMDQTSSSPGQ